MSLSTLAPIRLEYMAIRMWKEEMKKLIEEKYGSNLSKKKIDKFLDKKILEYGKNPKALLVNNYINREISTNLLEIIDYIESKKLIIGGEGCLFIQHPETDDDVHILTKFIIWVRKQRDVFKAERKQYPKGSFEWILKDLGQNNKKLKVNGLYGCLGCASFILFNKFIAESITNGGRQIICSAAMTFENFLGVDVKYNFKSEVFTFIHRIRNEIRTKYPSGIDCSPFYMDNLRYKVREKLCKRCAFPIEIDFVENLDGVLADCNKDELVILYYKNNFMEFNKTPIIRSKLKFIMSNIDQLRSPELDRLENPLKDYDTMINVLNNQAKIYEEVIFDCQAQLDNYYNERKEKLKKTIIIEPITDQELVVQKKRFWEFWKK